MGMLAGGRNYRLQLDRAGVAHVAYTVALTGQYAIRYGTNASGSWVFENVALAGSAPMASVDDGRVVVSSCGVPTVLYTRSSQPDGGSMISSRLYVAQKSGASWVETQVPVPSMPNEFGADYVEDVDVTTEEDGTLWVAATRPSTAWLIKRDVAGTWSSELIPSPGYVVSGPVVAIHPTFGPVLGYGGSSVGTTGFRRKINGTWTLFSVPGSRPVPSSGLNGRHNIGITADRQGVITLVWGGVETGGSDTLYGARHDGTWSTPVAIDTASSWVSNELNLWLDADGVPLVTYDTFSGGGGGTTARLSTFLGDQWVTRSISKGVSGEVTAHSDSAGRVFLLVNDNAGGHFRTQNCTPCSGRFCAQAIYANGLVSASLVVDSNDTPFVGIGTDSVRSPGLRVAQKVAGAWRSQQVYSGPSVVQLAGALDGQNRPAFSYWALSSTDLGFSTFNGTAWQNSIVDANGSVGSFSSVKYDSAGNPHIAYFDLGNGDLKYAKSTGSMWQVDTIDSTGDVGRSASLAFTAQGLPRIAYIDSTNNALKYASFNGTQWSFQTVDATSTLWRCDLAIDSRGVPHIAAQVAGTVNDLRHEWFDGTQWRQETVDGASTETGIDPAIAIDSRDQVHIAYGEYTGNKARHAHQTPGGWVLETISAVPGLSTAPNGFSIHVDSQGRVSMVWVEDKVRYLRR